MARNLRFSTGSVRPGVPGLALGLCLDPVMGLVAVPPGHPLEVREDLLTQGRPEGSRAGDPRKHRLVVREQPVP